MSRGTAHGKVDFHELGRAARSLYRSERRCAALRVDLGEHQPRALARQCQRQRPADAVARAGDERGFVLEQRVRHVRLFPIVH